MAALQIDYDASTRDAILSGTGDSPEHWVGLLQRSMRDQGLDVEQQSRTRLRLPWAHLLAARRLVRDICNAYGVHLLPTGLADHLLRDAASRLAAYESATAAHALTRDTLEAELSRCGFVRTLTREQVRNVSAIAPLPAAATFSVPGAGKTTEALAYFAIRARANESLLVVAPKNALGAWDEQLAACFGGKYRPFVRLRGGEANIRELLRDPTGPFIITYQQLARDNVPREIAQFVAHNRVFVFLDESHRIKGRGITSSTVLGLAFLPAAKLVLTGTPMPQSIEDLLPQFEFLYPEVRADATDVVDKIRRISVRTTKAELGLPPVTRVRVPLRMRPAHRLVYNLLKTEVARQAEHTLTARDRNSFRALGRSVMRILQASSNPALLFRSWEGRTELLAAAIEEGDSPKLRYAAHRAGQLSAQGKKVLIWSSFRGNVESLAIRLADLGAVYIHGSVDAGDEEDDDTREGKLRRFHEDPSCKVLVANPAAAAEGISLHTVCQHAIYVDRTYNAAHYLQSEDRIHRLGTTVSPLIEVLEFEDCIDQSVASRLESKVRRMADVLNDRSLQIAPHLIAFADDECSPETELGIDLEDVRSIAALLAQEA